MEQVSIEALKPGLTFTGDLLIDNNYILLPQTAEVTEEMIELIKAWGFEEFLCDGDVSLGGDIGVSKSAAVEEDTTPKAGISENVKKVFENSKNINVDNSDKSRMDMVQNVFDEYMNYIESVFTHYVTHKEINQEELSETVQELCIFIKEHRRYILRVTSSVDPEKKNFLVIHSMRTTVLAIAIGLQLHLPLSKMIELGVTCILHEIGMLRLPPQLYMSTKRLTAGEKAQISKHTLFGYSIIKECDFPLPIQLGVLEHHEKENGTGYPRKLTGDKISSIAKIVSVACTYEAISSPRSYKQERSTFDALLEMIQNKEHTYDDAVLKGLLYTVSLYPIGTYVFLNTRKVAEVIDSNPDNPKCPIVQLLTEKEADGSPKVVQTGNNISILRILSKEEKMDVIKLMLKSTLGNVSESGEEDLVELEELPEDVDVEIRKTDAPAAAKQQPAPKPVSPAPKPVAPAPKPAAAAPKPATPAPKPATSKPSSVTDGIEDVDISIFS